MRQAATAYFFDVLVGLKGPVVPGLASWAKASKRPGGSEAPEPSAALAQQLDPPLQMLFDLCDGTLAPHASCPFPWLALALRMPPVAETSVPAALQVRGWLSARGGGCLWKTARPYGDGSCEPPCTAHRPHSTARHPHPRLAVF
jgi:hypothetical protein